MGVLLQPATVRNIARAMRQQGRQEDAVALLREGLAENPADLVLVSELSQALPGDEEAKREELTRYLDAAEAAGAPATSIAALRAGVQGLDGNDPAQREQWISLARDAAGDEIEAELRESALWDRMGDPAKARAAFRRAEALDANHPQVILTGIKFAAEDKDDRKLEALAERASRENIDLAGGDFVRGQIAASRDDLNGAITFYTSGLEKRPVYDEGWKMLGDLYMRRNRLDDASNAYQTAVNQKPDNLAALVALAQVNRQRNRPTAAVEAMRQALRHAPDNPAVLQMYLQIESELGDRNEALKVQRQVAERQSQELGPQRGVAILLSDMGRHDDAMAEMDRIEQQFGASLATARSRATIAFRSGDRPLGREILEQFIAQQGDEATTEDRLALARYLFLIEEPDAAAHREVLRKLALIGQRHFPSRKGNHAGPGADVNIDQRCARKIFRCAGGGHRI